MNTFGISTIIIASILTLGCSTTNSNHVQVNNSVSSFRVDSQNNVATALYRFFTHWKGVPHKDGGMNQSGIDCSGFVYLAYEDVFKTTLPRTTARQSTLGERIAKDSLSPGNLVFFKTGIKRRHVGIYLGENKFIHASSSRGVTMSDLDNPYWKGSFWHARKINP